MPIVPPPNRPLEVAITVAYAKLKQARDAGDELAEALAEDDLNRTLDRITGEASDDRPQ